MGEHGAVVETDPFTQQRLSGAFQRLPTSQARERGTAPLGPAREDPGCPRASDGDSTRPCRSWKWRWPGPVRRQVAPVGTALRTGRPASGGTVCVGTRGTAGGGRRAEAPGLMCWAREAELCSRKQESVSERPLWAAGRTVGTAGARKQVGQAHTGKPDAKGTGT